MRLTLSNVKYMKELSEETFCFHAIVCVDGVKVFEARNDGRGGATDFSPCAAKTPELFKKNREILDEAMKWAETLPPKTDQYGETYDQCLETVVEGLLVEHLNQKDLKAAMRKKVLIKKDGKLYEFAMKHGKTVTPEAVQYIQSQHPTAQVLNAMDFNQALKVYMET